MDKQDKKYYSVTLSNGVKNIVEDVFSDNKTVFNESIKVNAEETNGELFEILTGKKILAASSNYNSNIFDVRKFIDDNYSLFGIKKEEIAVNDLAKKLHFITRSETTKQVESIMKTEYETKTEARKQYELLKDAERNFKEEINKGRK